MVVQTLQSKIKSSITPEFRFLFRSDFYLAFYDEVVTKTIKAIEDEQKKKLSEDESLKMTL